MWNKNQNKRQNKKSQIILIVFLLQGIIGFVILGTHVLERVADLQVNNIIVGVYGVINIAGIVGIRYVVNLLEKEVAYQQLLVELKKSDEVLFALRAHKHDFFNHLQIIMGLAQLNENDRIIAYISNISEDVTQSYDIANINVPEIAVVLMQKLGEASHKGIQVTTHIKTDCEGLRGEGITYAQILFNLLDNAICELDQLGDCEKILSVEVEEEKSYFQFIVFNNLPIITKENKALLFERGFTTKEGNHDGLGLWNVEKLVHMNKGIIKVESEVGYGTAFKVIIPK